MQFGLQLNPYPAGPDGNPWDAVAKAAQAADESAFDSLWLYDHLLYRDAEGQPHGIWEGWTMLSALAEATARAEIGSLVACTAFRNPALLAKMAATLDEVSGGRFTLGLGAGWNEAEFVAFGLPFDHRVARFQEALHIIASLVREGEVAYQGTVSAFTKAGFVEVKRVSRGRAIMRRLLA